MQLTRIVLSSAGAAMLSATALAADLPTRKEPMAPPPMMQPAFTWSGFYVGANAGAAFGSQTRFDQTTGSSPNNTAALAAGLRPNAYTLRDTGFTGGGQIGYNWQLGGFGGNALGASGGFVFGIEADAAYTHIDSSTTLSNTTFLGPLVVPTATSYTRLNQFNGRLDFLGTVRGRLGLAFDRLLVFGTGGFAYGGVNQSATFYGPNAPTTPFFQGGRSGLKVGYAYGGGLEYAIPDGSFLSALNFFHASAVTIKAEYLRYDLGSYSLTLPGVNGGAGLGSYTTRVTTDGNLARLGLNYKF